METHRRIEEDDTDASEEADKTSRDYGRIPLR